MKSKLIIIAGGFFCLMAFLLASTEDYKYQQMLHDEYCQRVADGIHTNYKKWDCE